jgi:DNA-binding NarL/FixJ family response regulator
MNSTSSPRSPVRLLIADDHLVLRQALREVFVKKGGYLVVGEASDGEDLLALARQSAPDVIIMDLSMPKVGGLVALEELRRRGIQTPVLVLSAVEQAVSIKSALNAGARGFVPKNVELSELELAIASVLSGRTYVSPSITAKLITEGSGPDGDTPLSVLSDREREILVLLANGKKNREIGKLLHISTRTVDTHRTNILKKLAVKTNAELVKLAISSGLVSV